jgi:hypothetical protein
MPQILIAVPGTNEIAGMQWDSFGVDSYPPKGIEV